MNVCINVCHDDFEDQIRLLFGKSSRNKSNNNNKAFDNDYDRLMETLCVCKKTCEEKIKPGATVLTVLLSPIKK